MSKTIITKTCSKCKQPKPLSEFYPRKDRPCGYLAWCKNCFAIYRKNQGRTNQKKYIRTEKGRICHVINNRKYANNHPEKIKARCAVSNAITTNKLLRPTFFYCKCGKPAEQYHHWKGYEPKHYLDVIPICIKCHKD